MRKVVITGMGAVTPIGNNTADMWDSMINGRHGISKITHFDTSGFASTLAAEVKDYDAAEYMNKKDVNRYDPYTVFGIGAASQAADGSGIVGKVNPERMGVYFSSGIIGEGGGALVLEEYEHAKRRGAEIYAEICGYGTTCDAFHITRPAPDADGAARAIKQAARESGLNTEYIYINAHGTSTKLNDELETLAIKKALGEDLAEKAVVSSTKSMTGHLLGGAGAVEAVASVMAMREGIIPPTIGFKVRDDNCDLDICPNTARKARIDLALSNSFGFGGHNACLAFKQCPKGEM